MKKTDKTQVPEKTGKVQKAGGNTKSRGTDGKVSVSLEKNEAWIKERCANCADIMMHKMYLGREADVAALLVFGGSDCHQYAAGGFPDRKDDERASGGALRGSWRVFSTATRLGWRIR